MGTTQDYPEHEKLTALAGKNETVGDFVEWLGEHGYSICSFKEESFCHYWPVHKTTERWLADYFGIDLDVLDTEKRAMLDVIRAATARSADELPARIEAAKNNPAT